MFKLNSTFYVNFTFIHIHKKIRIDAFFFKNKKKTYFRAQWFNARVISWQLLCSWSFHICNCWIFLSVYEWNENKTKPIASLRLSECERPLIHKNSANILSRHHTLYWFSHSGMLTCGSSDSLHNLYYLNVFIFGTELVLVTWLVSSK